MMKVEDIVMKHHGTVMMDIEKKILDLKLAHIDVQHDLYLDALVIRHTATKTAKKISRYEIERLRDPYPIILEIIGEVMAVPLDVLHEIIKQSQLSQAASTQPMPTWDMLNGPKGHGLIGAVGAVYEDHIDIDNYNMKQKLFTTAEQIQIVEAKKKIRSHIETHIILSDFNMDRVVVAGGCFASLLNHEIVKDFDVFMLDDPRNNLTVKALISFALDHPEKKATVGSSTYMQNDKIEHTLYTPDGGIQYITTKYKTREELINHFDFKHCCVSYDYLKDKLYITREAFDLIKSKTLVPNIKGTPALWRYEKFQKRGWKSDEIAYL
jgi:hypothetical protein